MPPSGRPHEPYAFKKNFAKNKKKVLELIRQGTNPKDACLIVFEVHWDRWYKWLEDYAEDVAAGYNRTSSKLIELMDAIIREDLKTKSKLEQHSIKRALEDDSPEMLKFVLERRYDYIKKQKSDVDVGTKEETQFTINITETEPRDD